MNEIQKCETDQIQIRCIATSENGWTSDTLCEKKSCIPQVKARNKSGRKMLLVFNGHGSPVTDRMIELAVVKLDVPCEKRMSAST